MAWFRRKPASAGAVVDAVPAEAEERFMSVTSLDDLIRVYGAGEASLASVQTIPGALTHPTVWRSVNKITGMIVQMPAHAYRDGERLPVLPQVVASPSPGMHTASGWRRAACMSLLLRGNVYAWVSTDDGGNPVRADLLHPSRVSYQDDTGVWFVDGRRVDVWPVGQLWHVPLMTQPGSPVGLNPIEYARKVTYAGLAAQEFGANFFRDGGHPTAILSPERDPGEDGARALKSKVMAATSGTTREPLVLPKSVGWTPIQVNPDDSQFIESQQFSGAQIAGFFGLDPSAVGLSAESKGMEYSNRENRQQDILQDAVMPVVIPLEEGLSELVGVDVKLSAEGLLRSDQAARFAAYEVSARVEQMTNRPILTNDEIRKLENRPVLPEPSESDV